MILHIIEGMIIWLAGAWTTFRIWAHLRPPVKCETNRYCYYEGDFTWRMCGWTELSGHTDEPNYTLNEAIGYCLFLWIPICVGYIVREIYRIISRFIIFIFQYTCTKVTLGVIPKPKPIEPPKDKYLIEGEQEVDKIINGVSAPKSIDSWDEKIVDLIENMIYHK